MKSKYKVALLASVLLATFFLGGCSGSTVKVPDLSGTDVGSAKTILTNLGLIPTTESIYSESVAEGLIVKTRPAAGQGVPPNSKVKIYISQGPQVVTAQDSQITWTNVSYGSDDWSFNEPYIDSGKLYIDFVKVKLMANLKWRDELKNGNGYGLASITDTFDKSIPLVINWQNQSTGYGQTQHIQVVVPVTDLDVQRPTDVYMKLHALVNGYSQDILISLNITW